MAGEKVTRGTKTVSETWDAKSRLKRADLIASMRREIDEAVRKREEGQRIAERLFNSEAGF